jgi:hypothetical protein
MTAQDNKNQGIYADNGKQKIINLIILDKSGSMSSIAGAAIMGFNKTIEGIREAQERYKDTQEHYVSLLTFCDCAKTYVYENVPVSEVAQLTSRDYRPCCCTPLYDAMGMSLSRLLGQIQNLPNATAAVTVITDGLENSSHEYSGRDIKALVERLQNEEGWNFAYIGTNQDVEAAAASISIKQTMYFEDTAEGMNEAWEKERKSKSRFFHRLDAMRFNVAGMSAAEKKMAYAAMNSSSKNYEEISEYSHRFTPNHIDSLKPNQIFVFGSNSAGAHYGGAARTAVEKFGAIMGQGEGLQGQSCAIPTMEGLSETRAAVQRFIQFADCHPEMKFLVTRIGCGIAGYSPRDIAPMFVDAIYLNNIYLPEDFWKEII